MKAQFSVQKDATPISVQELEANCSRCEHELEEKSEYIRKLEGTIESYENALKENRNELKTMEIRLQNKEEMILELENNFTNSEGNFCYVKSVRRNRQACIISES